VKRSSGKGNTGRRAKRTFTPEFKAEAVYLMRRRRAEGVPISQIARELDVGPALLWQWAQALDGRGTGGREQVSSPPTEETLEEEVRRLRREVVTLRQEREFAKKAAAFFLKESL
jgi:transposase